MVCDGDGRGLKDESFFVSPGRRISTEKASRRRIGVVYISRPFDKFESTISQKYQQLIAYRYAAEQKITVLTGETELNGFDYQPTLWNLIEGTWSNQFNDLIFYSAQLLPAFLEDRMRLYSESNKQKITIHFVAEDVIWHPGQNTHSIESLLRSNVTKPTPPQP
jgi:sporadic carbohydrate cluster protein (TIGR04323 family)